MGTIIQNKNAFRNYEIIEKFEAGLVLTGTEVKSLSHAQASINEAYITISKNEIYIINMHIAPFFEGNQFNVDPYRTRKLLMHKKEILKLEFAKQKEGLTIIPLNVYWHHSKLKLQLALAKGKKLFDKREDIKERDLKRQLYRY